MSVRYKPYMLCKNRIFVPFLPSVLSLYNRIRVYRSTDSTDGEDGTWNEITAAAAAAAVLTGSETGPFRLNGKTLHLKVDGGVAQTITFVSSDPIAVADVVDFINAVLVGAVASSASGAVRITSATTGTGSSLLITGGTALDALGFEKDQEDLGEDARITLQAGVYAYSFTDQATDPAYYYRVDYYHSVSGAASDPSAAVLGDVELALSPSALTLGYVQFALLGGRPSPEHRVAIELVYDPTFVIGGFADVGTEIELETDAYGFGGVLLTHGLQLEITILGTGTTRRITVPSTGTEFDLLAAVAVADDMFQIQEIDIPAAVRRS